MPATTVNLGPGFDVFGTTLSVQITNCRFSRLKIEGHPKNVVPAIYSGLCVYIKNENGDHETVVQLPLPKFKVVLCIPSFELRTKRSRQFLPKNLSLKDVVFNTSRGDLLITAFCCQDYPLLKQAMEDKTHQPYRGKMIHAMSEVLEVALEADAHGSCLSSSDLLLPFFEKKRHSKCSYQRKRNKKGRRKKAKDKRGRKKIATTVKIYRGILEES